MTFMRKCAAELVGTLLFVLIGCTSIVIYGSNLSGMSLALVFGITFIALYFAIGPVSGCHLNPAVSLGMAIAGRISWKEFAGYVAAQVIGALGACGLISVIHVMFDTVGYGANVVYTDTYGYSYYTECLAIEAVMTAVLVFLFISIAKKKFNAHAGVGIGFALTAVYSVSYAFTGGSENPARSLACALFTGGSSLASLWVFIVGPVIGGVFGALLYKLICGGAQAQECDGE